MNDTTTTEAAVSKLDAQSAFKLIEFYENAASVVKGRTWTITTWILTINAALLAFCFQLYTDHSDIHGFIWVQAGICMVGIALCFFLRLLIQDQGNHLRYYWTKENKVGAWNGKIQGLVLWDQSAECIKKPDYEADFPNFCRRLRLLTDMFIAGFVATFLFMIVLILTK